MSDRILSPMSPESAAEASAPGVSAPEGGVRRTATALLQLTILVFATAVLGAVATSLTDEKVRFLKKEELQLTASAVGTLGILLGVPSYLQPFLGAWTDAAPLFGYHRRSYFILGGLVNASGWLLLGCLSRYTYAAVAALLLVHFSGGVLLNVVFYATMAGIGNRFGAFGRLLSIFRFIPLAISIAFGAHLGGYVAAHWAYSPVFLAAAALSFAAVPLGFLIDEERIAGAPQRDESPEERAIRLEAKRAHHIARIAALREAVRSPGLWAITVYVFYLILTPGLNNTLVYYETDVLHFSKQLIGDLGAPRALGAALALMLFGVTSRRLSMRWLVWGAWVMDCISYPVMVCLRDAHSARWVMLGDGIIGMIYNLCLFTLAARACPKRLEGVVFGMVLAAIALGSTLSEKLGATLYEWLGPAHGYTIAHGWYASLWVGFGFTVAAVLLIPFLPKWTLSKEPLHAAGEA